MESLAEEVEEVNENIENNIAEQKPSQTFYGSIIDRVYKNREDRKSN